MSKLTIIIPVKNPPNIRKFMELNRNILDKYPVIIIDSGGGEALKEIKFRLYLKKNVDIPTARNLGGELTLTRFCLHLDCDAILPKNYIENAINILINNPKLAVVSIEYEKIKGHLNFGTSVWRTEIFNKLYDFSFDKVVDGTIVKVGENIFATLDNGWCECSYMWKKVIMCGYKMETLCCRAKHLKREII